jgi:regulator of sirC expression with transglutaminase-like and TPR domain
VAASPQFQGLSALLADADNTTVELVTRTVCANQATSEEAVRWVARYGKPVSKQRARLILQFWESKDSVENSPEELDLSTWEALERFCWDLAEEQEKGFKRAKGIVTLDEWARLVEERLEGPHGEPHDGLAALRSVLAGMAGLKGNVTDYYDPGNSLLSRVVETRKGIPLSLGLIYLFVGRRIGLEVDGLNTPGHYLVALDNRVFDPFFGGMELSPVDLADRFGETTEAWINPLQYKATPVTTAVRMLTNLANGFQRRNESVRVDQIMAWLRLLQQLPTE